MKTKIGDLKSMMAELTNLSKIWLFQRKQNNQTDNSSYKINRGKKKRSTERKGMTPLAHRHLKCKNAVFSIVITKSE